MDSSLTEIVGFLHNNGYRHIEELGKGSFGSVLSARLLNKESVAIKIVKNEDCGDLEESVWPLLKHDNVLPLLNLIEVKTLNVKLFVMPIQPYVLHKVLASETFYADKDGFLKVKKWFVDILKGLNYLHSSGYAHLDLKKDNILKSSDERAIICDFSGLSLINVPLRRVCSPKIFRPPECYDASLHTNIEGATFDIWLFGLMSLNILTDNWPRLKMGPVKNANDWKVNVEPILLAALHQPAFCKLMKTSFPSVCIPEEELVAAHDFVSSIMQWDPSKRPHVPEILRHRFLAGLENGNISHEETSKPKEKELFDNPYELSSAKVHKTPINAKEDFLNDECHEQLANAVPELDSFFCTRVIYDPSMEMPKASSNGKVAMFNDDQFQNFINKEFLDEDKVSLENVTNESSGKKVSKTASGAEMPVSFCDHHQPFVNREKCEKQSATKDLLNVLNSSSEHLDFGKEPPRKKKNLRKRIKGWFVKKWN